MSRQLTARDVTSDLYEHLQAMSQSRGESLNHDPVSGTRDDLS